MWVVGLFLQNLRKKAIERNEISDLFGLSIFNNVCIDNTILRNQTLSDIFLLKFRRNLESFKVFFEQSIDLRNVLRGHLSEETINYGNFRIALNFMTLHVTSHWLSRIQGAETDLNKLLRVHTSVIVRGCGNGARHNNSSRKDSLEDSWEVDSSGDFLDKKWRKSLCSQFLVHAQIVDLCHLDSGWVNFDLWWGSWDESEQLLIGWGSDAKMPFFIVAGDAECPTNEIDWVFKAECAFSILDIICFQ